ncbi:MAG: transposase [Anaerolineae bacterium]|nr:transposase [Anaerolineae bacterium]
MQHSPVDCFDNFIQTLSTHWQSILNYFVDRVTSGFVEGLNIKIKTINDAATVSIMYQFCFNVFGSIWRGWTVFFLSTP